MQKTLVLRPGIYQHLSSQKLYRVIGCGREVCSVFEGKVIYQSMETSYLRESNLWLPRKTIWIRPLEEFIQKFKYEARFMLFVKQDGVAYEH
jgi:hypothetical protein